MKINNVPFATCDWSGVGPTEHPGEAGKAVWRTLQLGEIRVRKVEYTPGYRADHWCERGHILLVTEGELVTELKDGRIFTLKAGDTYQVASGRDPHRSSSPNGTKLFIVD